MSRDDRDVIQVLTEDHRDVERIFGQLENLPGSSHRERRRLVNQAIVALVRHFVAEEEHLYSAARRYIPGGDQIVDREIAEHGEAEVLMKKLERAVATNRQFRMLLGALMQILRDHVREEENSLFPRLVRHADREVLAELGQKVAHAKATAPTRPHPLVPSGHPDLRRMLAPRLRPRRPDPRCRHRPRQVAPPARSARRQVASSIVVAFARYIK